MIEPTPLFSQIVTTGAGEGYSTKVYGLTPGGKVYVWAESSERRFWQVLENTELKSFTVKGTR